MRQPKVKRFKVIVADPPWAFGDPLPGDARGAQKHYRTMSDASVVRYWSLLTEERMGEDRPDDVDLAEPDSVLFLWRPAAFAEQGIIVAKAWGFEPKTEMVWIKRTKHGKLHFGMGRTVRASHETCIIATRGRPVRSSASVRSVFEAKTGRHSEKPDEFYALVEELFPGPYLELFARRPRSGWHCAGDQVG